MREIVFRGKRADNEKWMEGLLVRQLDLDGTDELCLQSWERDNEGVSSRVVGVIPSTAGQYTGIDDKNGVKIFEGDIIRHYNKFDDPAKYETYAIEYDKRNCAFAGRLYKRLMEELRESSHEYYEVIGNIHDNPELFGCDAEKHWCEKCCNFDKRHIGMDSTSICRVTGTLTYSQQSGKECRCFNIPAHSIDPNLSKSGREKLIFREEYIDNEEIIAHAAYCPACLHRFEYGTNGWSSKFCPDCGRALEWR